jgi:hypothetical protein
MAEPRSEAVAALRQRLGSLLRERGSVGPDAPTAAASAHTAGPQVAEAPAADDWAARIESLRQAQRIRESRRVAAQRALPGTEFAPGVRLIEAQVPLPPCDLTPPRWEPAAGQGGRTLVYLDTETTGLAGGTGTLVFLLGLAWHDGEVLRVDQWLLTAPGAERDWLAAIAGRLPPDPLWVSFNGKAFDLPLLAARHRMARCPDPFIARPHWDLLHPLRRAFESRWPDCRLQTAERRLLGVQRIDDLPGAFAPQAWTAFLRHGETGMLTEAIRHNRDDVVALARLLPALREVYAQPARFDADPVAIARRMVQAGRCDDAAGVLGEVAVFSEGRVAAESSTGVAARRELAALHARARRWSEVERLLLPLATADRPCAKALERLAKIAEHVHRDRAQALRWAQALLALDPANPRYQRRHERLVQPRGG